MTKRKSKIRKKTDDTGDQESRQESDKDLARADDDGFAVTQTPVKLRDHNLK